MKNNYITGIIWATVVGFLGSIPWIMFYLWFNVLFILLISLISMGILFGYKISGNKKEIDYFKLMRIFLIIGIVIVTLEVLVVIPLLQLKMGGFSCSWLYFKAFYSVPEVRMYILRNYIVSLLSVTFFTLGFFVKIK